MARETSHPHKLYCVTCCR